MWKTMGMMSTSVHIFCSFYHYTARRFDWEFTLPFQPPVLKDCVCRRLLYLNVMSPEIIEVCVCVCVCAYAWMHPVSLPQLKDLDWRVDMVTSSDSVSRMSVPTCLVQLKVSVRPPASEYLFCINMS